MFRKLLLGATVVGFTAAGHVNAGQSQFNTVSGSNVESRQNVVPVRWDDEGSKSIVSCDVASDKWGKFKPCATCADVCDPGSGSPCCDSSSCDSLCESGCSSGCDSGLIGLGVFPGLTGLIKKSEGCYDDFISPMTNPTYFEDPRQLTEARAIFINHHIPTILGNPAGRIQLYALQIRVRLTDNLSLIAVKDGYAVSQSVLLDDGWADLSAGLKYSLYRDAAAGQLLSVGARFEAPTGMARTLQGNGSGVLDIFASGGSRVGNSAHFLTTSGFVIPMNSSAENQFFYWSNHLDKRIASTRMYAFTELNWYHYMKNGKAFPAALQGGDLFNLGSVGIAGDDLVTNAYGMKFKPSRNIESGIAYEIPLTEKKGLMQDRLTVDFILRF